MNATTSETKKRKSPRPVEMVAFSVVQSAADKLGITITELARGVGLSDSYFTALRAKGQVPLSYALAAEALVRRQGTDFKPHYGDRVWLLKLSPDQQGVVGPILKAMNIKWTEV